MAAGTHHASLTDELASLVDAVQDYAIFLLAPDGEIRSWNLGAERIFGYPAAEVIGRNFSIFYAPADIDNNKPGRELTTADRDGRIEDEGWRVRKGGTKFWVNTVITALRNPDGSLRGFAKVTRDMTERRNSAEDLRRSEEMFRLLVSAVRDYAIFMLDPNGNVASWNAGAERIKGYTPEEIIGKHFSMFYTPEDRAAHTPERALKSAEANGTWASQGWRMRKDGSRFWADVLITAVHDERGRLRGFAKVTRDLTEQKQHEETREALLKQREARIAAEEERRRIEDSYRVAQEANRAKDAFLMTLSHELRTPMTAILGWSRLLPTLSPNDQSFRDAVDAIGRSAQVQASLIDDVLDMSRIISGKMRLSREVVDVGRVLNSSIDSVRAAADARSIAIVTEYAPGLGTINADPARMQQVIWNLLTNAVKFTPKHGKITLAARKDGSDVIITVTDNGEGIAPEFLPYVFEPFRQAENPSTRVHGGLGLGLSIVRYIVEAHGGTIRATSEGRGRGATFTVRLPAGALTNAVQGRQTGLPELAKPQIDSTRLARLTILVVDDDRGARLMIATVLRQSGANVMAVESAEAAIEAVAKRRPDIIITDIAMPDVDGIALMHELRGRKDLEGVKLVALTAFRTGAVVEEQGAFDLVLMKPIDPFELVDVIAGVAGRH